MELLKPSEMFLVRGKNGSWLLSFTTKGMEFVSRFKERKQMDSESDVIDKVLAYSITQIGLLKEHQTEAQRKKIANKVVVLPVYGDTEHSVIQKTVCHILNGTCQFRA